MRRFLVLALLALLPSCGGIPPIPWPPTPPPAGAYDCENPPELAGLVRTTHPLLNSYIVVLKEPTPLSEFSGIFGVQGLATISGFAATISDQEALTKILVDPRVAYVQENGWKYATVEWGLDRIDQRALPLDGVFEPFGDGAGVNVAIVDTGITDHTDFSGRLQEDCFTAHTFGGCTDRHGHGTHVTGTACGTEFGVAKAATIWAVRVLNEQGSGSDSDVIAGIEWVVAKKNELGGEWVINMSLGGSPSPALDAATCRAIEAGVTVAVAAGNDGQDAYGSSPARVKQAITVGASDDSDRRAYFSNDGPGVDLFAPGVGVRSAKPGGGSQVFDGTSMASPHVAGAAALVLQVSPGAAPGAVAAEIVGTATPNVLSGLEEDTANRLLFVGKGEAPPPQECIPGVPWCHETGQTCSTEENPCKHNPTQDPDHCEIAPACPEVPLPQPQCPTFTDRGGNLRPRNDACDCYAEQEWIPCEPTTGDCPWGTPTAASMAAQGLRVEVLPKKEGRKLFGATPRARFGRDYYCQPGLWPEACASGRTFGPVAPDGHPDRVACEKQFLQRDCPYFTYESQTHMSFDPWFVIGGVNQNHPRNVAVCGQGQFENHPTWVRDDQGYIKAGEWSLASGHGNGSVCAEAKDGVGKTCTTYIEP